MNQPKLRISHVRMPMQFQPCDESRKAGRQGTICSSNFQVILENIPEFQRCGV